MERFKKRALLRCQRFPANGSYEKLPTLFEQLLALPPDRAY